MIEKTVRVVGEVLAERQRLDAIGDQRGAPGCEHDHIFVWSARLTQSSGMVATATIQEHLHLSAGAPRDALIKARQRIRKEAIRTAATATSLVEFLDAHTCRSCGCTDEAGCAEGCSWVEPGLCSQCSLAEAEKSAAITEIAEAAREAVAI